MVVCVGECARVCVRDSSEWPLSFQIFFGRISASPIGGKKEVNMGSHRTKASERILPYSWGQLICTEAMSVTAPRLRVTAAATVCPAFPICLAETSGKSWVGEVEELKSKDWVQTSSVYLIATLPGPGDAPGLSWLTRLTITNIENKKQKDPKRIAKLEMDNIMKHWLSLRASFLPFPYETCVLCTIFHGGLQVLNWEQEKTTDRGEISCNTIESKQSVFPFL